MKPTFRGWVRYMLTPSKEPKTPRTPEPGTSLTAIIVAHFKEALKGKPQPKRDPPTTGNMRLVFDRKPDHVDIYLSLSDIAMEIVRRTNMRNIEIMKTEIPPDVLARARASADDDDDEWDDKYSRLFLRDLIDNYPMKQYDPNPLVIESYIETITKNLEVVSKQIDQLKKPITQPLTQREL